MLSQIIQKLEQKKSSSQNVKSTTKTMLYLNSKIKNVSEHEKQNNDYTTTKSITSI